MSSGACFRTHATGFTNWSNKGRGADEGILCDWSNVCIILLTSQWIDSPHLQIKFMINWKTPSSNSVVNHKFSFQTFPDDSVELSTDLFYHKESSSLHPDFKNELPFMKTRPTFTCTQMKACRKLRLRRTFNGAFFVLWSGPPPWISSTSTTPLAESIIKRTGSGERIQIFGQKWIYF
jgi:hypothetical protein